MAPRRVALVLAGCGVFDGSELHEASAVLVHLSRAGAEVKIFAPNMEQMHVVNHLSGNPTEEKRNVLVESARIARGNIQDLVDLKVSEFDAVIFPDGSGEESELGDLAQPSLTQIKVNCNSCHHLDVMDLFENERQTQQQHNNFLAS